MVILRETIRETSFMKPRRFSMLLGCFAIASLAIIGRLLDRSVLQTGLAEVRAEAQAQVAVTLNPFRGHILVRGAGNDTVAIALNEPKVRLDVIPKNLKDAAKTAKLLAPLIGMSQAELFDKINNDKPYLPPIKRDLTLDVQQKIDDLHLVGVTTSVEATRTYPEGRLAAQALGFVNGEGNGQYGVEGYYDNQLQGLSASVLGERDGWGNTYVDQSKASNNKGADIVLTVNRDVQVIVEQYLKDAVDKFKAKSGSVTIVEPATGKIIAMAAVPSFDPNSYKDVKPEDLANFKNPIISRTFEPGSVMKSITLASALDAGKITPEDTGVYGASVKVDNSDIHTAQNKAFGKETVTDVLVNSDNVAIVDLSSKLGKELEYDYMGRFNFNKKTGVDLDTETSGSMPPLKEWRDVNRATIAFGQGISVTALQMTMAYAALANKGIYMQPYMVDEIDYPDGRKEIITPKPGRRVVGEQAAGQVTDMLIQVVERGHGKKAGVAGYRVAGKTGTAQIAKPDGPGYLDGKNNGSFAGFAPSDNPQFTMFVTLEEPQGVEFAESSAAPLWGVIADYLLKTHYHVPPKQ